MTNKRFSISRPDLVVASPPTLREMIEKDLRTSGGVIDGVVGGKEVNEKPTNPKDIVGSDKIPFHLWPETATAHGCLALLDGAGRYGRTNWRPLGVRASIYYDACRRHLNAWFEGQDFAPDSGVHHLGHALACLAIILDAEAAGQLNDDRMFPGGYHLLIDKLTEHVTRVKAKNAEKSPRHYTIQDAE